MLRFLLILSGFILIQQPLSAQVYKGSTSGAFYIGYGFSTFKNVAPLEIYSSERALDTKKDGFGSFRLQQGLSFRFCSGMGEAEKTKEGSTYYPWSVEMSWTNKHAVKDAVYEDSSQLEMRQKIRLRMNSFNVGFIYTPPFKLLSFGFSGDIGFLSCKSKWDIDGKSGKWEPLFRSEGFGSGMSPVINYSLFGQLNLGKVSVRLSKQSVIMSAELGPTFYTENFNLSAYFRF